MYAVGTAQSMALGTLLWINEMEHLQQILMKAIDPSKYSVRVYERTNIHDENYNGDRMFLPLADITELPDEVGTLDKAVKVLEAQLESNRQLLVKVSAFPHITISNEEPIGVQSWHLWFEQTTTGLIKSIWVRQSDRWISAIPSVASFTSGSVQGLLNQQVPIDLLPGCKGLLIDRFQIAIHIVTKLGSLLGYNIGPRYIEPNGSTQAFQGVSSISTISYPANTSQVIPSIAINKTLMFNEVSALSVAFEPIGLPGSIRVNGSFTYYGIRA